MKPLQVICTFWKENQSNQKALSALPGLLHRGHAVPCRELKVHSTESLSIYYLSGTAQDLRIQKEHQPQTYIDLTSKKKRWKRRNLKDKFMA